MYSEKQEIVLFGIDEKRLNPFVPEMKIRMNKGKAFDVKKITSSKDTYEILKRIYGRNLIQENFIVLLLNRANKLIGYYRHTVGSSWSTIADIPMIVGLATKAIAHSVIVSHNHPSQTLSPSEADVNLTQNIRKALNAVGIALLDHIIFTSDGYYSFADEGVLNGLNGTTMITIENIIREYPRINQDSLPDVLKQSEFEFIKETIDLYNDDETIKKYIDTFVEKLNSMLVKGGAKSETKEKKQPSKEKKPQTLKPSKKPEKKEQEKDNTARPVEKVMLEVSFIKRFVGLHGKTKEKGQILSFLNALQKVIIEKRIRKISPYAKEIEHIQQQLIKCYEQMGNTIKIMLDDKVLESYTTIAHSEKAMLSVLYIKQYIGLHGKQEVKEKAKALHEKIEKAIESGKIAGSDPYYNEISEIQESLKNYTGNKTKVPVIKESTLNGIMTWMVNRQRKKKVARYLQKIHETEKGLRGVEEEPELNGTENSSVISSTRLPEMQFETIGLQGKYRELIGDPCVGFTAMAYGLPKSGKSTLCIDFARHLAENHGKVLYVAIEEKFGYTLKEKFERLNAIHPDLVIAEKLPVNLSDYRFVFIDSVSKAKLTTDDLVRLRNENPKVAFVFIFHTTKEGNFRGKQDFAHDVDVIIDVENGVAKANGRFGVGGRINIFNE
jgi:purine-nucleoside phosphorylase